MNEHLAVFREQDGMETALGELRGLRERFNYVAVQDKSKTFKHEPAVYAGIGLYAGLRGGGCAFCDRA